MKHAPAVKSVMTAFPYSVEIGESVEKAVELMQQHAIRHLPVTEQGKLVGVISDRDIKMALNPNLNPRAENSPRVRDVCVLHAYIIELSEPLHNVLLHMAKTHIGSALVVRKGKLVGIFTASDACRCYGEHLRAQYLPGGGNEAA
ncbi:MAG: CBS domain-containing protein [Burkholderiales bacterium]